MQLPNQLPSGAGAQVLRISANLGPARAGRHPHPSTNVHSSVDWPICLLWEAWFPAASGWEDRVFIIPKVLWGQLSQASFRQPTARTEQCKASASVSNCGGQVENPAAFYMSPKGRTSKEMSSCGRYCGPDRIWLIHSLDKLVSYYVPGRCQERNVFKESAVVWGRQLWKSVT